MATIYESSISVIEQSIAVIPAFNEERTIGSLIEDLYTVGFQCVLVVDDCSIDETAERSRNSGAIILKNAENLGYQQSLYKGFKYALANRFEYFVTFDADGELQPVDAGSVLARLRYSVDDVVVGARNQKGRWAERFSGVFGYFYSGLVDPFSGLKGYKISKTASDLESWAYSESFGLSALVCAIKSERVVSYIPITVIPRKGQSRIGSGLLINIKLLEVLVSHLLFGVRFKKL